MSDKNAQLGILMLDTAFPRVLGDIGNAQSFPFAVRYAVVEGATPQAIVQRDPAPFVQEFIVAGKGLVATGCRGIATTCGFLSLIRPQLATALGVPVAASALEQIAQINAALPEGKRAGVLTISAESLTPEHLRIAGAPVDTPVRGMDGSHFATAIIGNAPELDPGVARAEIVAAARQFAEETPGLGALVLECTNMPPYADDIAAATSLPVHSMFSYLTWFEAGLAPRSFG
ncbi:aspartate/glutamate racemase family protein [uncultured Sulfitobacter sp.]|uniref:aspartate/glutamate racemase family protein n=1 Tax=uncultured Sulfitobacter sp. TaxID=191468 RepID=UPI0026071135|nr:aspartate/glutamate racemase family protein [uncultured Sulfitobacter sp.]